MKKYFLFCFVLAIFNAVTAIQFLYAAVPNAVNYQGRYREYGQPISGQRTMYFIIYGGPDNSTQSGATAIWNSGPVTVNVSSGIFNYAFSPVVDLRTQNLYLEMDVVPGGSTSPKALMPREQLTANWYAFHAMSAEDIEKSAGQNIHFAIGSSTHVIIDSSGDLILGQSNPNATLYVSTGGITFPDQTKMNTAGVGSANSIYSSGTITIAVTPAAATSGAGLGVVINTQQGATGNNNGGNITMTTGASGNGSAANGGSFTLTGGAGSGAGTGGGFTFTGGNSGAGGTGGNINLIAGTAYSGTNGAISLATGGSTVLAVAPGGNVGIGTTNPAQKLDVEGVSYFNGNVGIGTSSPGEALAVNGNEAISTGATSDSPLSINAWNSSFAGSMISLTANQAGSSNFNFINATAWSVPYFTVKGNGQTYIAGPVGIGTNSPATALDVNGSVTLHVQSSGSQSISAYGTWIPSAGIYNFVCGTGIFFQLYISASWVSVLAGNTGTGICDGTNMKFYNGNGSSGTVYWQKF